MNEIDKNIHEHNTTLKLPSGDERIIFEVSNSITGKTIKVTLEGNVITCKDCRDKILWGSFVWSQKSLRREKI